MGEELTSGASRSRSVGSGVGGSSRSSGFSSGNGSTAIASYSSRDFSRGSIVDDEVLADDTADLVVGIVTGVALASVVVDISGLECARLECIKRVATDLGDLLSELKSDLLVDGSSTGGGGILVLGEGSDLRVLRLDGRAENGGEADLAGVALDGTVDEPDGIVSSEDIKARAKCELTRWSCRRHRSWPWRW